MGQLRAGDAVDHEHPGDVTFVAQVIRSAAKNASVIDEDVQLTQPLLCRGKNALSVLLLHEVCWNDGDGHPVSVMQLPGERLEFVPYRAVIAMLMPCAARCAAICAPIP